MAHIGGTAACPCSSGDAFGICCSPVLAGERPAATAEALMRSRYSAFVTGDVRHLERSWHPDTRPADVRVNPLQEWTGLHIVDTELGRALDATGVVEFIATSRVDGRPRSLHERSRFARVDGAWVYVDAEA